MEFSRPDGDFPKIWHRFQAKDKESNELVTYVVQDFPEKRYDEFFEFMAQHFMPDEPLCSGVGIPNDPNAKFEYEQFIRLYVHKKMSLACFREGSDEIVAVNLLYVATAADAGLKIEPKSEPVATMYNIYLHVTNQFDHFKSYGVDKVLLAGGLGVHKDFRRRGIAIEMLKARAFMCQAFGIKLTSTFFTAIGSQIAAQRAGFEENFEFDYADLPAVNPAWNFPNVKTKSIKIMSMKV